MKDKCFVDTNVLVYAHDRSSGAKHERAQKLVDALWDSRLGVLSTQVLQELCVSLQRKTSRPPTPEMLRELIEDYMSWEVVTNTPQSVLAGIDLAVKYRISFWDALIVYAAQASGASILYSEDMSHGQRYGSVQVTNPFSDTGLETAR